MSEEPKLRPQVIGMKDPYENPEDGQNYVGYSGGTSIIGVFVFIFIVVTLVIVPIMAASKQRQIDIKEQVAYTNHERQAKQVRDRQLVVTNQHIQIYLKNGWRITHMVNRGDWEQQYFVIEYFGDKDK